VLVVFRAQRAAALGVAAPAGARGRAIGRSALTENVSNIARRGAQSQSTTTGQVEGDKYTVLLLDEEQLDRFLSRPRLKSLGSHFSRTVDVWPRGRRVRVWGTAAAAAVLAIAVVWLRAAGGTDASVPPGAVSGPVARGSSIPTGASFSVNTTTLAREADARGVVARLTKAGLPSFAWRLNGAARDVLVGPFVSIDEAEAAQREVARLGYAGSRLHVDERLRDDEAAAAVAKKASPAVVLVAAPGRLAVAFELAEEPQQVSGRRVDSTTFEVTATPGPSIDAQEWSAPSDVQLVRHVSVAPDPRGMRGLQVLVNVAESAAATVRLQGTRVYVDVSRPQLDLDAPPTPPAAVAMREDASPQRDSAAPVAAPAPTPARTGGIPVASVRAPAPADPGDMPRYRQTVAPVFARFEEIQPFLRSAVAAPTPEVLAAVAGTFAELEQALRTGDVPRAAQPAHGLMLSAIQLARGAVAPTFSGDRMTQVREANAQFQAAKAQLR
jgi:hypothetical protein